MAEFGDKSCALSGQAKKQRQGGHIFSAFSKDILKIKKAEIILVKSLSPQPELRQKGLNEIYIYFSKDRIEPS